MSDALIVGIIAAVAGLLSSVVGWFLNHPQVVTQRTKQLEALKARIDLIEKLSDSRARLVDNYIEKLKVRERELYWPK